MYLLDTSSILEILYNTEKGKNITELIGTKLTKTTSITIHEVAVGEPINSLNYILDYFDKIDILSFDKDAAMRSFAIERELRKEGKLINKIDIFIAGICEQHNLILITLDKDFNKVKSIKSIIIN